jgi:uncharacterized cupredoxin-like copper-binding protein
MTNDEANTTRVGPTLVAALAILAASLIVLGVGWLARRHADDSRFNGAEKIEVHESSYHLALAETTVKAGKIGFDVHNDASIPHEFVVFETKLAADHLPRGSNGDVIEDSPQLKDVVDSGSALNPGSTRALIENLKPGHYAVVCNLPGHYGLGMHVDLTVTAH